MTVDTSAWSGEGEFTASLIEALKGIPEIDLIKVEDAPASRAESGYNFLSNEIYVRFVARRPKEQSRPWRVFAANREAVEPSQSMAGLGAAVAAAGIGEADYADEGMLQYLKTERIVPPYQTRGTKLVELVRVYELKAGDVRHPSTG
jgi:hypothetical protein